jgi:2-polyprenyl-3-methyl-5-hydroxy-6-metoxy-1,4-benzoquinol methylase
MRSSVYLAKKYLSLATVPVPTRWTAPRPLERAQMEYDDECAGGFLKWFKDIDLRDKQVFDVGCGYGGRPVRYAELGAKRVVGSEVFEHCCKEATQFARTRGLTDLDFIVAGGESLPFPDNCFDVITSNDVFEHVENVESTLRECVRVLRPRGVLYAIFPPFYHPTGAHLNDFISWMPWANVLFRCETVMEAVMQILRERNSDLKPTPLRPKDRMWCLNGATVGSISRALRMLKKDADCDLKLTPLFSPMNSRWEKWRMRWYAPIFEPLPHVPLVREMFTHRMVLKVTKKPVA